ncbi:hypothetical protein AB0M46_19785 [Dactylosporangium sp. NPDC051485]|uniref:hypothetical protein n=1 Tax=Dactylosporangium sp. NPDC051485 TaxID=3154846 RepID=UPI003431C01E
MLRLTDTQVHLLLAMSEPHNVHVKQNYAWIARRPYPVADLYALRAARLVQGVKAIQGARGLRRLELTERGAAEALRLTAERAARSADAAATTPLEVTSAVGADVAAADDGADAVRDDGSPATTPNDLLRLARLATSSQSRPGQPMSRQELADAVNAAVQASTGRASTLDRNAIWKLEAGRHRWPAAATRAGFRAVLGAERDTDLGFYIIRGTQASASCGEPLTSAAGAAPTAMSRDCERSEAT